MRLHVIAFYVIGVMNCGSVVVADETLQPRGEKITLQLNLKEKDRKQWVHQSEATTTMASRDMPKYESTITLTTYITVRVDEVDSEGVHKLTLSYDRLVKSSRNAGITRTYDSKSPPKQQKDKAKEKAPLPFDHQFVDALAGKGYSLRVSRSGETKEAIGLAELAAAIQPKYSPPGNADVNVKAMKNSAEMWFHFLPDKPIDIGDSWTRKIVIPPPSDKSPGRTTEATYTLVDRKEGKALIKMKGTIFSYTTLKETTTGSFSVDEATGWIVRGEIVEDADGILPGTNTRYQYKSKEFMTGK